MKKILLMGAFVVASASLHAAAIVCEGSVINASPGSGLSGLNQDGYQCGDKLFTNFAGTAPAGTVTITLTTANLYTVRYAPTGGSTSSAFTFNFNVGVVAPSTDLISQIQTQMLTSGPGGGNASTANTGACGGAAALGGSGSALFNCSTTSSPVTFSYTPNGGSLISYEVVITQTPGGQVPEPGSMALLGSGLLALGFVARKRKK